MNRVTFFSLSQSEYFFYSIVMFFFNQKMGSKMSILPFCRDQIKRRLMLTSAVCLAVAVMLNVLCVSDGDHHYKRWQTSLLEVQLDTAGSLKSRSMFGRPLGRTSDCSPMESFSNLVPKAKPKLVSGASLELVFEDKKNHTNLFSAIVYRLKQRNRDGAVISSSLFAAKTALLFYH